MPIPKIWRPISELPEGVTVVARGWAAGRPDTSRWYQVIHKHDGQIRDDMTGEIDDGNVQPTEFAFLPPEDA